MRTRQVQNALILAEPSLQLVSLSAGSGSAKYDSMWLNQDKPVPVAKDMPRYTMPGSEVVSIPITFFTRGWLQVLTDSEISNWLVWRHRAGMNTAADNSAKSLKLNADDRLGIYDLTRDAWDTHQVLGNLGLLTATPGEITSTVTPRHEFGLDNKPLQQDAHHAVLAAVAATVDYLVERNR
jgi:hypothetical protein